MRDERQVRERYHRTDDFLSKSMIEMLWKGGERKFDGKKVEGMK
jgi:hypothetical protein